MPRSWLDRTTRSARGSPSAPSRVAMAASPISAPMRLRMSMMARRVGFVLTPARWSSASGWIAPATSQKAAADGSDGTESAIGRHPGRSLDGHGVLPVGAASLVHGHATGAEHPLGVVPGCHRLGHARLAVRRERRQQDRGLDLCAGDGRPVVDGDRCARPVTARGSRVSPCRPSNAAPIARSGSTTRPIGRRRSEASPSSTADSGRPASSPATRRVVVPELPQSRVADGSTRASPPGLAPGSPRARRALPPAPRVRPGLPRRRPWTGRPPRRRPRRSGSRPPRAGPAAGRGGRSTCPRAAPASHAAGLRDARPCHRGGWRGHRPSQPSPARCRSPCRSRTLACTAVTAPII